MITWFGFFLALVALMIISRKNLAIGMLTGALILGVFTMPPAQVATEFREAFTDLPTILLALAVGLIPIIGGTLKSSGQMDNLVNNIRVGKKAFLAMSPALIGMLPMPGGALLSCPLVEKGGKGVLNAKKAALNVWFRHILYLVYPLAPSLIVSANAARLDIYQVIPYLVLPLLFSLFLGYFFFLRDAPGKIYYEDKFSLKKLVPPLTVILMAPVLDFSLKAFVSPEELATLIGVTASLVLAIIIGRAQINNLYRIAKDSKPWNFALMIVGIATFLNVFNASNIPELIAGFEITAEMLCVVIGFLLGFGTGRIVTPAGIVIPIFLTKFGPISPIIFTITYFSIFLGYALSPVHPCVSLSAEFFKIDIKSFIRVIAPPALIAFAISFFLMTLMRI